MDLTSVISSVHSLAAEVLSAAADRLTPTHPAEVMTFRRESQFRLKKLQRAAKELLRLTALTLAPNATVPAQKRALHPKPAPIVRAEAL